MRRGLTLLAALAWLAVAEASQGTVLSHAEYDAHKHQIESDFKADRSNCDRLTDNDRQLCVARASGHRKIAQAELNYNATGSTADAEQLAIARADFELAVARELCVKRKTQERALCVAEAQAVHARALQDLVHRRPGDPASPRRF